MKILVINGIQTTYQLINKYEYGDVKRIVLYNYPLEKASELLGTKTKLGVITNVILDYYFKLKEEKDIETINTVFDIGIPSTRLIVECNKSRLLFRSLGFNQQRFERGFDNSDLWNLDSTLAKLIKKRLQAFKACGLQGWPKKNKKQIGEFYSQEEVGEILDSMITAFDLYNQSDIRTKKEMKQIQKGFKNFITHYNDLWN